MNHVPVLAVFVALLLPAQTPDHNTYILQDGTKCRLAGTAKSAVGKALNRHKNRSTAPDEDQIDPEVSLAALLAPGNDENRFDQEKGARITAFVIDVQPGGKGETCNCGAKKVIDMDTHIELGLASGVPGIQRVIVEVTPRLRLAMKDQGEDWSSQALSQKIKGKWVEVTGWLLFDSMHVDGAENTNPGGDMNWRATCWEIHPLTSIKVLANPPPALAALKPADFSAMHSAHAEHVASDPRAKEAIQKRNKAILAKFDPSELEEKEMELKDRGKPNP
jgi:hypothetical protein